MSATLINFLQMASIPCAADPAGEATGICSTNIDGVCIRGGTKIAGSSGYQLASLGYPAHTCAAAGLFVSTNVRYAVGGVAVFDNANLPRLSRPML